MGKVQINIGSADYNLFLNLLKGAGGRWTAVTGGTFEPTYLDDKGYPTDVPVNGLNLTVRVPPYSTSGRYYRLYWDGTGTLSSTATLSSGSYSTSGCQLDLGTSTSERSIQIRVLSVGTPGVDYPHNMRLLADNGRDIALHETNGKMFNPDTLALFSQCSTLRLMDFQAGAANGGNISVVNWADRRPQDHLCYGQYYFAPNKLVPTANITYDGVSKYTVTWTGQSGALADKTQFIAKVPTTSTGLTFTNINGTGDIANAAIAGGGRNGLTSGNWCLWTYDSVLNKWLIDSTGGASGTGIAMGAPIEICVRLANELNVAPWFVAGAFWGDCNGNRTASDFPANMATYVKNNLTTTSPPVFELGANETFNNSANNIQTGYSYNMMMAHNGSGSDIYNLYGATTGASLVLTIGPHTFSTGDIATWANIDQQGLSPGTGTSNITATTSTTITINIASTGTFVFNGGAGFVARAYAVTAATAGATTTLTVGTNSIDIGSLVVTSSIGGLAGLSSVAGRVLSKPSSTQIEISTTSTGTYTSGGRVVPTTFDVNNWVGLCANNLGAAIASVYGIGNKGITYRPWIGLTTFVFGIPSSGYTTITSSGQTARLTSPYMTARGGQSAYYYASEFGSASYIYPGYDAGSTATIAEGELAYEYADAGTSTARKTAILNEYALSTFVSVNSITITSITPGNPTVLTVDSTKRLRVSDGETISFTGITGNIGTVLNRGSFNSTSNTFDAPTFAATSKTETTITVSVDTTGKVYSGGGTVTPAAALNVSGSIVYDYVFPNYVTMATFFGLKFSAYEGGLGPDLAVSGSSAAVKGITNGATTKITIGANIFNKLYNTTGLTGLQVTISNIAAGTLATLLNGNTYTVLSADATSITINVDTSAVSSWVSGGSVAHVNAQTNVNLLRSNFNFCPDAATATQTSYAKWNALGATFSEPSEFVILGTNYGMFNPDLAAVSTAYRYQAARNRFQNKRRMKW